jgi:hypothetical protein
VEPHAQAVFLDLVDVQVGAEPQHFGEKTTGHLGGAFADFPVEHLRPFDDQYAKVRELAFQQNRRGRSGKRASDDDHIVVGRAVGLFGDRTGVAGFHHLHG